jgi:hypothetical protein
MKKAAQTKKVAALIQAVRTRQQSRLASAATASSSSSPAPSPASQAWSEDINMVDADSSSDHTAATSSSSDPSSMDSDSTANINDGMIPTTEDRLKLIIELEKRGKRAPPSIEERRQLIEKQHSLGHFGKDSIFHTLYYDQDIWWPSMHRDINDVIRRCDACLRYNVARRGYHPTQHIRVSKPGDHFQIDLSVHLPESPDGYKAILHLIDVFTGFVILRPLKDELATTIAQELFKIFMVIGWPRILQSDNGGQFISDVVHSLNSMLGVMSRRISAFNPRADGKVERSIGVIMQSIKKLLHGSDRHWPLFLDFAQFV